MDKMDKELKHILNNKTVKNEELVYIINTKQNTYKCQQIIEKKTQWNKIITKDETKKNM